MPFLIIALPSGVTRISLEGSVDGSTAERLLPELAAVAGRGPSEVEIEFERLRSIDPCGMAALLAFVRTVARHGCRITINGPVEHPPGTFKSRLTNAILHAPSWFN